MASPLAARTLDRASTALQASQIAGLPEIVKLLRTLSGNSHDVSVSELAELIQKDAVVMAKVIGAANTFAYNPSAVPVSGVVQAIHVIGYERIRCLTMSLMLAEQTARRHDAEELRELTAQALAAGCIAQAAAEARLLLDQEQAFICASLRSFGRIVLASCMLDEYRAATARAASETEAVAFREIFGLTPLELGAELLRAASLPEEILVTLRALPPSALAVLASDPDGQMLALTDFAAQLAEITLDPRRPASEFARDARELAAAYQKILPGLAAEVPLLVEETSRRLSHFVHAFRLKSLPPRCLVRLRQCRQAVAPRDGPAASGSSLPPPAAKTAAPVATPTPLPAPAAAGPDVASVPEPAPAFPWAERIDGVSALLHASGTTRDQRLKALLAAVRDGLGTTECLLFSAVGQGAEFTLTHGDGSVWATLARETAISATERTVFGVCLARRENVLVHHAQDPKLAVYLPGWLRRQTGIGAFMLLPLVDGQQLHGTLLAGWNEARQISLSPGQVRALHQLIACACRDTAAAG